MLFIEALNQSQSKHQDVFEQLKEAIVLPSSEYH